MKLQRGKIERAKSQKAGKGDGQVLDGHCGLGVWGGRQQLELERVMLKNELLKSAKVPFSVQYSAQNRR